MLSTLMYSSKKFQYLKNALRTALYLMIAVFLTFISIFSGLAPAQAEANYSAEETVRSHHRIMLKPEGAITFTIKFKNTGDATWRNDGQNFVAIATQDPEVRESGFRHTFWEEPFRAGRMVETSVAPGEVATFKFALQAPAAEGEYNETFQAVARQIAWIEGAKFTIPIIVTNDFSKYQEKPDAPENGDLKNVAPENTEPIKVDYPIRDAAFQAGWVGGDRQSLYMKAGSQVLKKFEVKNTGTSTWRNTGNRFVSLYTVRPNYHESKFASAGSGWMDSSQIRLSSDVVAPGETAIVTVLLQAPETNGVYKQNLRLASEDHSWISQGELELIITIGGSDEDPNKQVVSEPTEQEDETSLYKDKTYAAKFFNVSHPTLTLQAGQTVDYQVTFKNVGEKNWNNTGERFISLYTINPSYHVSKLYSGGASGWLGNNQVKLWDAQVGPGGLAFFRFQIKAPLAEGTYRESFRMAVEDLTWVKGGEFDLVLNVEGGNIQQNNNHSNITIDPTLGPLMRIGLYDSEDPFVVTTDTPFDVVSGNGKLLATLPARPRSQSITMKVRAFIMFKPPV